ncbi:MAG: hypothetical protein JXR30_01140 [Alphaproteobacteria bacterium]|nr:hypothetical protein [Alphaproteobacteria bacterium]
MKKLIMLSFVALLGACTFYPMGMSEAEWNALTPQQRIEMREKDAKMREERQLRYAIERQNRLKEDRILSDNKSSESTAQAAAAAASAAQAASQSASAAQQASQNTSSNNITFNPNIVVSNTNQNDLSNVSDNTNSNAQNQANSNDSNAGANANNSGSVTNTNNAGNGCRLYNQFMKKGNKYLKKNKNELAKAMYQKAHDSACTEAQKKTAQDKIDAITTAGSGTTTGGDDAGTCKKYEHFMKKGNDFMTSKKYKQAVDMYTKALARACTDEQKATATAKVTEAQTALDNSGSGNNGNGNN